MIAAPSRSSRVRSHRFIRPAHIGEHGCAHSHRWRHREDLPTCERVRPMSSMADESAVIDALAGSEWWIGYCRGGHSRVPSSWSGRYGTAAGIPASARTSRSTVRLAKMSISSRRTTLLRCGNLFGPRLSARRVARSLTGWLGTSSPTHVPPWGCVEPAGGLVLGAFMGLSDRDRRFARPNRGQPGAVLPTLKSASGVTLEAVCP